MAPPTFLTGRTARDKGGNTVHTIRQYLGRLVAVVTPRTGDRGASLVEYALLVGLIALVAIGAVTAFGVNVGGLLGDAAGGVGNG
jgi:Flp pilus assembly pilin Flp